ncbi:MAG: GYF domain-containing protein [Armatimonadota bacterium]|nr:GYF domain-containing protein [Armatimonadota bacterium]
MADENAPWLVRTSDGETLGPFDADELAELLAEGRVGRDDLVKSEDTGRVRRVRDVLTSEQLEAATAPSEAIPEEGEEAEGSGMDRLLPALGRQWVWLFVPTFGMPVGFLVALAYWLVGWLGAAHCRTTRGERSAEAVIKTARNWLIAWAVALTAAFLALFLLQAWAVANALMSMRDILGQ